MRSAKVVSRGCSGPLQRAIVDFAADQPFALARAKLREHYGFEIGESTIQRVTLGHAGNMFEAGKISLDFPEAPGRHKDIVAETDGGMIPIVEPDARQKDKRKGKTLSWREAKISLAHAKGSRTPIYAGAIEGGVETAGRQLLGCAVRAGFGADSRVHAVGDGAAWIVGQVEAQFGPQGGYLIDFYHVCEYLSAAVKAIAPDAAAKEAWMEAQKEALKTGHLEKTLQALARHLEPPQLADDQAPVRTCHRYLSGRKNQLDYRDALARDLPIGSGEIESAHRYIAQKRLKLPGAWWRVERADAMLALRVTRINGDWDAYWSKRGQNKHDTRLWRIVEHYVWRAGRWCSTSPPTRLRRGAATTSSACSLTWRGARSSTSPTARTAATVKEFADFLEAHGGRREAVTDASIDMGAAFEAGIKENLPNAEITFDKFHVIKLANEAVDPHESPHF